MNKKLISLAVAGAMLAGSVGTAMAQPYRGYNRGYAPHYNNYNYGHRHNNNGAALAFGLLAFGTIAAIAATNNNRYYDNYGYGGYGGYYNYAPPPPPPPPPAYRYGPGYGYGYYGY